MAALPEGIAGCDGSPCRWGAAGTLNRPPLSFDPFPAGTPVGLGAIEPCPGDRLVAAGDALDHHHLHRGRGQVGASHVHSREGDSKGNQH